MVAAATAGPGPFGTLLQRYRAAAGLSQEELAEWAGLSRRGISDLELLHLNDRPYSGVPATHADGAGSAYSSHAIPSGS
jgi:hypothetical protein